MERFAIRISSRTSTERPSLLLLLFSRKDYVDTAVASGVVTAGSGDKLGMEWISSVLYPKLFSAGSSSDFSFFIFQPRSRRQDSQDSSTFRYDRLLPRFTLLLRNSSSKTPPHCLSRIHSQTRPSSARDLPTPHRAPLLSPIRSSPPSLHRQRSPLRQAT